MRATSRRSRPSSFDKPVAVVAHMSPIFALLAAPLTKPLRVPLLLWFTQQGAGAVAAGGRARRRPRAHGRRPHGAAQSPKVRAIGHGIDVAALPCVAERRPPLRRLLGLGRYAPVKGWETVLRALPELPDATLSLHGPLLTACRPGRAAAARDACRRARPDRPRHVRRRGPASAPCRTSSVSRMPW